MSQFKFLGDIAGQYGNSYIPLVEGRMRVTGDEGLSISDAKEIARKAAALANAAPEMLEALKTILDAYVFHNPSADKLSIVVHQARAAISKATGA